MPVLERIDLEDNNGAVSKRVTSTTIKLHKEPSFVKVYLADILQVQGLSSSHSELLFALLREMNYRNLIHVSGSTRKQIAKDLGVADITLTKGLEALIKQGIMLRQERGVYMANPYLFGRGTWKDIREIRMTVRYIKGEKTVETEIVQEEEAEVAEQ